MTTILLMILPLTAIGGLLVRLLSRKSGESSARTNQRAMRLLGAVAMTIALTMAFGCEQDTNKTKQQAAEATEKLREEGKAAGVEIKKDTKEAVRQTKAIAEGVKQGLQTPEKPVNVNSASKNRLQTLPGVDEETADRIIAGRPYHTRDELGAKGVVSPEVFNQLKGKIAVK